MKKHTPREAGLKAMAMCLEVEADFRHYSTAHGVTEDEARSHGDRAQGAARCAAIIAEWANRVLT